MALREYSDPAGIRWTVWNIAPRFEAVRSGAERRLTRTEVAVERRSSADRRRRVIDPMVLRGWLCFESERERRRLSPVPPDWQECGEEALARYCESGRPVRRSVQMPPAS